MYQRERKSNKLKSRQQESEALTDWTQIKEGNLVIFFTLTSPDFLSFFNLIWLSEVFCFSSFFLKSYSSVNKATNFIS